MALRELLVSTSPLAVNVALSIGAGMLTYALIPALTELFITAKLFGHDINKVGRPQVPEPMGVISAVVYLICLFCFIPFPFLTSMLDDDEGFPHNSLSEFLCAALCICCMILLGFADDMLNLRWRHKLLLPTLASVPLLMVYYVNFGQTSVVIPRPLQGWFGSTIDLGAIYYVYMGMLAVFCTNSINILAGINGVEAGQSLVIGASIALNNIIQIFGECCVQEHTMSLYLIVPFLTTTAALFAHNWYPSRAFVGDTFCYFAGMTFAVVGVLGHFSKTMILFFIPQVINFVYSAPQLFRLIDCPRHRLPHLNPETKLLEPSQASLATATPLGKLIVRVLASVGLARVSPDGSKVNNFTLINLVLLFGGTCREDVLAKRVLMVQVACSVLAFVVRYPLAQILYS